jgi:hypothetical protein
MSIAKRGSPENLAGPKLDRNRPFATIAAGVEAADDDPLKGVAFYQNGNHYYADGSYHSGGTKAMAPPLVEAAPAATPTGAELSIEQVAELAASAAAEPFMDMDVPALQEAVTGLGGPAFSGDDAKQYLIAWLVRNTAPSEPLIDPNATPAS